MSADNNLEINNIMADKETEYLRALMIDASNGFYRINKYPVGAFYGPVDLGIHLAYKHNSLNVGAGLLAGSVFPGSNRLIFTGISPSWHAIYPLSQSEPRGGS